MAKVLSTGNYPPRQPSLSRPSMALEVLLVLGLFSLLLMALPASRVLGGGLFEHIFMLFRIAAAVLLCTFLLWKSGLAWRDVGLTRPKSWWRVAGLVLGGYLLLAITVRFAVGPVLESLGLPGSDLKPFQALKGNLGEYLFFAIPVSWGTAAFGEEMLARGYLLTRLAYLFGGRSRPAWWMAALAQGLIFGAAHAYQGAGGVISLAAVGAVFGAVYVLGKRNLWACIILHGIVDFTSVTALYFGVMPQS